MGDSRRGGCRRGRLERSVLCSHGWISTLHHAIIPIYSSYCDNNDVLLLSSIDTMLDFMNIWRKVIEKRERTQKLLVQPNGLCQWKNPTTSSIYIYIYIYSIDQLHWTLSQVYIGIRARIRYIKAPHINLLSIKKLIFVFPFTCSSVVWTWSHVPTSFNLE